MMLTRTSHQSPTATGDVPTPILGMELFQNGSLSVAIAPLGVLDGLSSTTPRPSGRKHNISQHLSRLATNTGERCGLRNLKLTVLIAASLLSVQSTTAQQYAVVDTGRTTCYNATGEIVWFGPAINPIFKVSETESWYWAGTTCLEAPPGMSYAELAVYLAFGQVWGCRGGQYVNMHGAGAQRSDPKSVAAPTGGEGDEIRIYNFVRYVRDE